MYEQKYYYNPPTRNKKSLFLYCPFTRSKKPAEKSYMISNCGRVTQSRSHYEKQVYSVISSKYWVYFVIFLVKLTPLRFDNHFCEVKKVNDLGDLGIPSSCDI